MCVRKRGALSERHKSRSRIVVAGSSRFAHDGAAAMAASRRCSRDCRQCQLWGALAFDEPMPDVGAAVEPQFATEYPKDMRRFDPEYPKDMPEYPKDMRRFDRDFVLAKRKSPHLMRAEQMDRLYREHMRQCQAYVDAAEMTFKLWDAHFSWDTLWPTLCRLAQSPHVGSTYIGASTDLSWRWARCESHHSMTPHRGNGWDGLVALAVNFGNTTAAMEELLQKKLSVHFDRKVPHANSRWGVINAHDVVFLCALVRLRNRTLTAVVLDMG